MRQQAASRRRRRSSLVPGELDLASESGRHARLEADICRGAPVLKGNSPRLPPPFGSGLAGLCRSRAMGDLVTVVDDVPNVARGGRDALVPRVHARHATAGHVACDPRSCRLSDGSSQPECLCVLALDSQSKLLPAVSRTLRAGEFDRVGVQPRLQVRVGRVVAGRKTHDLYCVDLPNASAVSCYQESHVTSDPGIHRHGIRGDTHIWSRDHHGDLAWFDLQHRCLRRPAGDAHWSNTAANTHEDGHLPIPADQQRMSRQPRADHILLPRSSGNTPTQRSPPSTGAPHVRLGCAVVSAMLTHVQSDLSAPPCRRSNRRRASGYGS